MKFDGPLGPSKPCPVKHAQTQIDRSGVKTDQFVLESKLLSASDLHPTAFEEMEENFLVQRPWSMLIGIGEGGSAWSSNSQMFQFTLTGSQTSGNFPQRMSSTQLTEKHGHKLPPTGESPSMPLGFRFSDGLLKVDSRKQL
jgi:hypothetical protein